MSTRVSTRPDGGRVAWLDYPSLSAKVIFDKDGAAHAEYVHIKKDPNDRSARCIHLGGITSEQVVCPSCRGGGTKIKLFECAIHGRCLVRRSVEPYPCCERDCNDYRAED